MRRLALTLGVLGVLLAAQAGSASAQSASAARRSLARALSRGMQKIGGASSAYVVDLQTGQVLFARAANAARIPASVEKLYTTSTVLLRFGPSATLSTSVLGVGSLSPGGVWHGTLYLRGGGDPTFGSAAFDHAEYGGYAATIQTLAARVVHQAGIGAIHGAIVGDESYFDSLRSTSESGFRPDIYMEGELSALAFDRGWDNSAGSAYQPHPALYAAQQLAAALRAAGASVGRGVRIYSGRTPSGAKPLAAVQSPRIARLVDLTNTPSDNFFAEILLKGLGAKFGGAGSTAAGADVVRALLASRLGLHPHVVDGSGLSYSDSTSPKQVVTLLRDMAGNSTFFGSLAIGGETGTLQDEMGGTAAQGNCHGKTGTLSDVANLSGYCRARDGHMLAFAFLANSVSDTASVHSIEGDQMAPALASYDG